MAACSAIAALSADIESIIPMIGGATIQIKATAPRGGERFGADTRYERDSARPLGRYRRGDDERSQSGAQLLAVWHPETGPPPIPANMPGRIEAAESSARLQHGHAQVDPGVHTGPH